MGFEESVEAAIATLPDDLRDAMSNVAIMVEDEPPAGQPLLGLYEGIRSPRGRAGTPARRRTRSRSTAAAERLYGHDPALLQQMIRRVVLHEIAHHFGISDERLVELDRY